MPSMGRTWISSGTAQKNEFKKKPYMCTAFNVDSKSKSLDIYVKRKP